MGFDVNIMASNTFPVGVIVSSFADDADPFDIPSIQIADKAMGINGDLIIWSKANPIIITLNMIPQSFSDLNRRTCLKQIASAVEKPARAI